MNENDLIASLKQNKITGAGLDVMTNEPIEENEELLNLKNIILTLILYVGLMNALTL